MTYALIHYGYGDLGTADIRYVEVPALIPGPLDVVVKVLQSPLNPSDVNTIEGRYVFQPPLPSGLGREGMGRVCAIGVQVTRCKVGDRVISIAPHHPMGFWRTETMAEESSWWVVPDQISDEVASELSINGLTAYLMLTRFVALQPGEWVIQNAPGSSVAHWVRFFCAQMGVGVVGVARDLSLTSFPDEGRVRLGLNAVGGQSVAAISKRVEAGGTIVTYGALSKQPPHISNTALIYRYQTFVGFLRSAWVAEASLAEVSEALSTMCRLIEPAPMMVPHRRDVPLDRYREALGLVQQGARVRFC